MYPGGVTWVLHPTRWVFTVDRTSLGVFTPFYQGPVPLWAVFSFSGVLRCKVPEYTTKVGPRAGTPQVLTSGRHLVWSPKVTSGVRGGVVGSHTGYPSRWVLPVVSGVLLRTQDGS